MRWESIALERTVGKVKRELQLSWSGETQNNETGQSIECGTQTPEVRLKDKSSRMCHRVNRRRGGKRWDLRIVPFATILRQVTRAGRQLVKLAHGGQRCGLGQGWVGAFLHIRNSMCGVILVNRVEGWLGLGWLGLGLELGQWLFSRCVRWSLEWKLHDNELQPRKKKVRFVNLLNKELYLGGKKVLELKIKSGW